MQISVRLKPGSGKVAYFADLSFDDKITVLGCPVFNGKPGDYRLKLPSRKGEKGYFDIVKIAPSLESTAQVAVEEAIRKLPARS